jgi:hypothetical protein
MGQEQVIFQHSKQSYMMKQDIQTLLNEKMAHPLISQKQDFN